MYTLSTGNILSAFAGMYGVSKTHQRRYTQLYSVKQILGVSKIFGGIFCRTIGVMRNFIPKKYVRRALLITGDWRYREYSYASLVIMSKLTRFF